MKLQVRMTGPGFKMRHHGYLPMHTNMHTNMMSMDDQTHCAKTDVG